MHRRRCTNRRPERCTVLETSARLADAVRQGGGQAIAVGTTAMRAAESATGRDGVVSATSGWTDPVARPERRARVVDGLLTGLHEPEASHLLTLEAIAGQRAIGRGYGEALRHWCPGHEFGDDTHPPMPEMSHHGERHRDNGE